MPLDRLSDDDYDRLARHVAGEGDASERAETERWADADADRRTALIELRQAWKLPLPDRSWDVDAAWKKVAAGLPGVERERQGVRRSASSGVISIASHRRWWQDGARLMQIAAAAVILIGGALLLPRIRGEGGSSAVTVASTSFSTRAGERRTVKLPDGSTVVLGVSSTLRTVEGYGNGARDVELEGEALFTVGHDEARPFRVHVGGTIVEDLGTSFAIRRYPDDAHGASDLRVAVSAGSVAIHRGTGADTSVVLRPRDVATIRAASEIAVTRDVDVSPFTAFASGRLIFVDTPFAEVADELQRWYGVEVKVSDSTILERHLTSEFEGESLDEVLRIIGLALDVRYQRSGNRVDFMTKVGVSVAPQPPSTQLAEAGV